MESKEIMTIPDDRQGHGENGKYPHHSKRNIKETKEALKTASTQGKDKSGEAKGKNNARLLTFDPAEKREKQDFQRGLDHSRDSEDYSFQDRGNDVDKSTDEVGHGYTYHGGTRIDDRAGQGVR